MDDDELIRAFQGGDESAFSELVGRHRKAVYRIARGILRSHARADEAAQDAFVKAWQGLPSFRHEASFKTWMYRIAMNAAFDMQSREATQARAREASALSAVIDSRPTTRRPVDDLIDAEDRDRVRAAISALPEKQRATLLLRVHDDLKYTEIAEVLGCHVGTAKANFHHALQNLREALGMGRVAATATAKLTKDHGTNDGIPAGDTHEP